MFIRQQKMCLMLRKLYLNILPLLDSNSSIPLPKRTLVTASECSSSIASKIHAKRLSLHCSLLEKSVGDDNASVSHLGLFWHIKAHFSVVAKWWSIDTG